MGGVINVAFRFKSDETICQERWTNNLSILKHPKVFAGDEDYIKSYINMTAKNDFKKDPYAMGKHQPLQNNEYGLIVYYFISNTIFDNNYYTNIAQFSIFAVSDREDEDNDEYNEIKQCTDAGLLFLRKRFITDSLEITFIDQLSISYKDAIEYSKDNKNDSLNYSYFIIDTKPMKYINFKHKFPFRKHLIELDFPMNKATGLNKSLQKENN